MARPPQISRSFPLLTLLMAIPLVAILGYVAYTRYVADEAPGDGWKTYRNERFKYEIRLPPSWEVERESGGDLQPGLPTHYLGFVERGVRDDDQTQPRTSTTPPLVTAPRAIVRVNPQGDWCLQDATRTEVTISGIKATEYVCYAYRDMKNVCHPQPRCATAPWGIMREVDKDGWKYWIISDVSMAADDADARFEVSRKVVQSFRFVD